MRSGQILERFFCIFIFIGLMVIASCTHFRAELKPPPPQISAYQPAPISVGAFFPEVFRKYEARYEWGDPLSNLLGMKEVYFFPVGNDSIPLLLDATHLVFDRVLALESIPNPGKDQSLRGILSFEIADVSIFFGRGSGNQNLAEVTYRIRAYDMKGREEVTWTVTGKATTTNTGSFTRPPSQLTQAVEKAMRDAAEKLVLSFHELPEVQGWLESLNHP